MAATRIRPPLPETDLAFPARVAESAWAYDGVVTGTAAFCAWFADCRGRFHTSAQRRALSELSGWRVDPETGNLVHETGRFFRVEGLDVYVAGAPIDRWSQPIISQPEVGILGILVKEFGGVLHCLMQAKVEPGNCNGVQLSPTVQATRSNYTRVHRGAPVPYLDYFRDLSGQRVISDVRQSEQGAWFRHKRNRNMIVETIADVEVLDGFCWLTIGQLHQLLRLDHLINMDTRTVLSGLPMSGPGLVSGAGLADTSPPWPGAGEAWHVALVRSCGAEHGSVHTMSEILSWITDARTRHDVRATPIPLRSVRGWHHVDGRISHDLGLFFDVVGVGVHAAGREVGHWHQPMIAPRGTGLVALFVRRIDGVLHALMHARVESGYLDVAELAATVQCNPHTCDSLGTDVRPAFLDEVLAVDRDQIRFDVVHSEEGGRFLHAWTRYVIVETDLEVTPESHPSYRWMTVHQLGALLQHSHYLNVQARSIVACLHSLVAEPPQCAAPVAGASLAGGALASGSLDRTVLDRIGTG